MTDKATFGELRRVKTQQEFDDFYAAGCRNFYLLPPPAAVEGILHSARRGGR